MKIQPESGQSACGFRRRRAWPACGARKMKPDGLRSRSSPLHSAAISARLRVTSARRRVAVDCRAPRVLARTHQTAPQRYLRRIRSHASRFGGKPGAAGLVSLASIRLKELGRATDGFSQNCRPNSGASLGLSQYPPVRGKVSADRDAARVLTQAVEFRPKWLLLFRPYLSGSWGLTDRLSLSRHGKSSSERGSVMI